LFKYNNTIDLGTIILFAGLSIIAESLLIPLPSGGAVSVGFAISLSAVIIGGPFAAYLVNGLGVLLRNVRDPKRGTSHIFNTSLYKSLFNFSNCSIAAGISGLIYVISSKKFDDKEVLKNLDLDVFYGEKLGILGKNGSGKTTLLKLILNEYSMDSGEIKIGSNVKVGYLEQVVKFENEDITILDTIVNYFNISQGDARKMLASYMFIKDDVFKKVKSLSGGEKSRLKLCILMNQEINLLILDEPTNHLDIGSREILEETLLMFNGTIIFISHDRFFINRIAKRIVELNNKRLDNYLGNYDYYKVKKKEKETIVEEKRKEIKKSKVKPKTIVVDENKKIERELKKIEVEIEELERLIKEKDMEMTKHSTDHNKLNEIYLEKCKIEKELEVLLENWTNLQELLN